MSEYRLTPPKTVKARNYIVYTYYEVVTVCEGVAICKMETTKRHLMRRGWKLIGGESEPEAVKHSVKKKKAPKGK